MSRLFTLVYEVEMTELLQETKSTHASEYSSGSPDEPQIKNCVCDANFASARASESAQLNSSTSSNFATYYRQPYFTVKSHLIFAGIIRNSPLSPRWQDKG